MSDRPTDPGDLAMSDDDERAIRDLVQRAAASVAVGPVPVLDGSAGRVPRASRRRRAVATAVLATAAAAVIAIVVVQPWDQSTPTVVTDTGDTESPDTTAIAPPPSLGTAKVVGSGMAGVGLPRVSGHVGVVAGGDHSMPTLPTITFSPPPGWMGGTELTVVGEGTGNTVNGFASASDDPLVGPSITAFYSVGGVVSKPGEPDTVTARDGTAWTVRSVGLFDDAIVAFSLPLDGHAALLFRGFSAQEWRAALAATGSADPSSGRFDGAAYMGSTPVDGPQWLPPELAGRWRGSRSASRSFLLPGPDGHSFAIRVSVGDAPERLVQEAGTTSQMVWEPSTAELYDSLCQMQGTALVCARNPAGPAAGQAAPARFLTVWRDGNRIDVTDVAALGPAGPADLDPQASFDLMAQVVDGLSGT